MFPPRRSIRDRVLSGADLMIDFLTLGEYGLESEPVGGAVEPHRDGDAAARVARLTPGCGGTTGRVRFGAPATAAARAAR